MTSDETRQQAQALTLIAADNTTGYFGVYLHPGTPKPYHAQVSRGGKSVHLGNFATAKEAALCVARSPEGQAAAERAAEWAAGPGKRKAKAILAKKVEESGLSEEELAQRQQGQL